MTRTIDLRKSKKRTEEPPKKVEESPVIEAAPLKPDYSLGEAGTSSESSSVASEAGRAMSEAKSPPEFSWEAPSFYYNPQKKYLALIVMALMAGAAALLFYDRDILLAVFLMLSSLVLILYANKKPDISKIKVDQAGVSINDKVYYYRELRSFWVDYNPGGQKELSLESRKWYLPHIKVSIEKEDPIELRSLMVNFVPERVHEQSLIDHIARKLGI